MKNEEKANNIIIGIPQHPYHITYEEVIENFTTYQLEECLLDMAEWKDSQYAEEKKELVGLVNMLPINENNQTIIEDLKSMLS